MSAGLGLTLCDSAEQIGLSADIDELLQHLRSIKDTAEFGDDGDHKGVS